MFFGGREQGQGDAESELRCNDADLQLTANWRGSYTEGHGYQNNFRRL